MSRIINLDEELQKVGKGFEQTKPGIVINGKEYSVAIGLKQTMQIKYNERKMQEEIKNLSKSKKNKEEINEIIEDLQFDNLINTFKILFGEDEFNEILDMNLNMEQMEMIFAAVQALMLNKEFSLEKDDTSEKKMN